MNYNICIPIPVRSNDFGEVKTLIDKAIAFNPKFIEFRFDYFNFLGDLTLDFVDKLNKYVKNKTYTIFTFRRSSEGGESKIDETERLKILKMLMEPQPDFFDIEMNSNKEILSNMINISNMKKTNLIFSHHNFKTTSSYQLAKELILRFEERIVEEELNEFDILSKSIYKVIFTAENFEHNIIPLTLCKEFSKGYKKIISFCMGDLGYLSRVFCVQVGSFMTYAALEEKTAPGQINIETLQKIFKLLFSD
ncbi:MAG: type I 3-dehydroquinate dehydratase [Candidatus Thorarchaeota archaeon]